MPGHVNCRSPSWLRLILIDAHLSRAPNSHFLGSLFGWILQYWQLKAFAHPYPYPKRVDEPARQAVETMLREISSALALGSAKPSADRGRGFRSFRVNRERGPEERYNVASWACEISAKLTSLGAINGAVGRRNDF